MKFFLAEGKAFPNRKLSHSFYPSDLTSRETSDTIEAKPPLLDLSQKTAADKFLQSGAGEFQLPKSDPPLQNLFGGGSGDIEAIEQRQLLSDLSLDAGELLLIDLIRDGLQGQKIFRGLAGVLPYVVLQGDFHKTVRKLVHDPRTSLVQGIIAFPILFQCLHRFLGFF